MVKNNNSSVISVMTVYNAITYQKVNDPNFETEHAKFDQYICDKNKKSVQLK